MLWNCIRGLRITPALKVVQKFYSTGYKIEKIRVFPRIHCFTLNNCRFNKVIICESRCYSQGIGKNRDQFTKKANITVLNYTTAVIVLIVGLCYAAVPLYRIFCQAYSLGGTVSDKVNDMTKIQKVKNRQISVQFTADVNASLNWNFRPQQSYIKVAPGETALAFYTAENPSDKPIVGVSTYNVVPYEAGQYFNKIQCFCFEEQMLNPHEQVDMPVFFYIDPEFCEDPRMENVDNLVLSYTFFQVKEGMNLPFPSYYKQHNKTVDKL